MSRKTLKQCPKCGALVREDALRCEKCGFDFEAAVLGVLKYTVVPNLVSEGLKEARLKIMGLNFRITPEKAELLPSASVAVERKPLVKESNSVDGEVASAKGYSDLRGCIKVTMRLFLWVILIITPWEVILMIASADRKAGGILVLIEILIFALIILIIRDGVRNCKRWAALSCIGLSILGSFVWFLLLGSEIPAIGVVLFLISIPLIIPVWWRL